MKLNTEILKYINQSVLCWLATCNPEGQPNVSPKELFTPQGENQMVIANVASPQSVKNIQQNPKVCLSFVDILVQKGYQLKGTASIIKKEDPNFLKLNKNLKTMAGDKYPYDSIILIQLESAKQILAPSYILYPEITVEQKIADAKKQYGLGV